MSTPEQEAWALDATRRLLLDLSSGAEKRVPSATRERARRVARHYPMLAGERWLAATWRGIRPLSGEDSDDEADD